jgi:WD40 repeat protein
MTFTRHRVARTVLALLCSGGLLGIGLSAPANATAIGSEGKIVFVRANQIYTMTKTGASVTQLTTVGKNYRPKWSPDGKHISYIREDVNGKKNVFEMTATGTKKTKVTSTGQVSVSAVWSPDGKTLAYGTIDTTFGQAHVYTIKATAPFGSPSPLQVFPANGGDPGPISVTLGLAWSPNGENLAVANDDSEDSPDRGIHLVHGMTIPTNQHAETVTDITGGSCCGEDLWTDLNFIPNDTFGFAQEDLIFTPSHFTLVYPGFVSQNGDKAGAPSPSGAHMVFVRTVGTVPNIWTSTIKGATRKQIQANGYQPDWQPLP